MKNQARLIILFLLMFSSYAQAQFKLSAEVRPRAEFRNGFKTPKVPNTNPAFFIEQRSRIYLDYQMDKLEFRLSLQDVRIWGSVSQIYKSDPNLTNVFEGWGKYNFNENFALKVGRQTLIYDNERFLGGLGWAQQGRSHDAVLVQYKSDNNIKVDLGLAYNQNWQVEPGWLSGNYYNHSITNNYKAMQFIHFSKTWDDASLSALFHNDGRQVPADSSMAYRQTLGLIGNKDFGNIKAHAEFYYQGGKNGSGVDVSAFLASAYVTFSTDITPITVGVDYLTGNGPGETKDKAFNPLYGTNHAFYGLMDYFYVGNSHSDKGLTDIFVKTNFKVGDKSTLAAHLHYFNSGAAIEDPGSPGNNLSSSLGTEVDLVYVIKLHPAVTWHIGYSQMFSTSSMVEIKGGNGDNSAVNNWAWSMLTFKPTLFNSAKND